MLDVAIGNALEDITDEVLEVFLEDYIWKFAYIDDPQKYQRTNQFADAWEFTDLKRHAYTVSKELFYNEAKLTTFNPRKFQHGSKYSSPPDVRNNLPAILEGKRSSLWISVERKVKFWERFIDDMISKGELTKIIDKHFRKIGLVRF